ncbi:MAG: type IV pilus assembly protein PilM [Candidatus Doudnabacteria bacterium]
MHAFGLDLSDQSLKLIELKREGRNTELSNFCEFLLQEGTVIKGRVVKEDLLVAAIEESRIKARKGRVKTRFVVACVPEYESFVRIIKLPRLPEEELAEAVKWESEQHIPLSGSEVYLDWQKVGESPDHLEVLVAASPKKLVDSYINVLRRAGLIPIACEVESAATARSLVREGDNACYLIADIGISRTSLIIYDRATLQFTASVEPAGETFTNNLVRDLKISLTEAEGMKKIYGLNAKEGGIEAKIYQSLKGGVEALAKEIETALKFYQDHFPQGQTLSKVILCGGGAKLKGLVPELKMILKKEVVLGDPWVNILAPKSKYLPEVSRKDSLGYATAIGLALRGMEGI